MLLTKEPDGRPSGSFVIGEVLFSTTTGIKLLIQLRKTSTDT